MQKEKPANQPTNQPKKQFSEENLQTTEKRRKVKSKGEKERYIHLNAEFQRIARRDKKTFLIDQYKEIEENNKMGKTRDLLEKISNTKGTIHAKMGFSHAWETFMQVKKQQLELDMEQQTFPNQERSTSRLYIVTLLI